ncbi:MAG: carotenoid biosynthesis protein, partial [Propionibacteriaceae bacterium]|nr:carotenoid biosynthesis protein [Propionibacteriaceae bacterium]
MGILRLFYSAFDTSHMTWFTFAPSWVIPDMIVLLLGVLTVGFVIRKEERPTQVLLEMFCFIFLYASIYENMATVMGWYGYGKSLVMVFNVPLSVPLIEALFVYAGLRLALKMRIQNIARVGLVGCFGVLADLTLDPLSLSQVHGGIGRWSWYIGAGDVNIFGAPVYNYTGWFILCGYAAAFIL